VYRFQGLNPKDQIIAELVEDSKLANAKMATLQKASAKAMSKVMQDIVHQLDSSPLS